MDELEVINISPGANRHKADSSRAEISRLSINDSNRFQQQLITVTSLIQLRNATRTITIPPPAKFFMAQ